jgi:hypothetical protein
MLILGTVGAVFEFFGLFTSVLSIVFYFSEKPIMVVISIISIVLSIASIVSLILLYMKKRAGLIMKMLVIGLSLVLSIFSTVVAKSDFVENFNKGFDSSYNSKTEPKTAEQEQAAASIKGFVNQYGEAGSVALLIMMTAVGSVVSGLLWFFAWKSQLKHDSEFLDLPN